MHTFLGIMVIPALFGFIFLVQRVQEKKAISRAQALSQESNWRVLEVKEWVFTDAPSLYRETFQGYKLVLENDRLNKKQELVYCNMYHPDFDVIPFLAGALVQFSFRPDAKHDRETDDFDTPSRYLIVIPAGLA